MDGLDDFEKALAAEKAARESEKNSHHGKDRERHKHRHHKSRHHRSRDDDDEREGHRHKRSRHSRDRDEEDDHHRRRHTKSSDLKEDLPLPDEEEPIDATPISKPAPSKRDSWMTAPSALDIDYTQRGAKKVEKVAPLRPDYDLKIHKNELNSHLQDLADGKRLEDLDDEASHDVDYVFGDSGAQWRMTKLKAVYTQAEQSKRSVEDVAVERFGDLRSFDDAREEQTELERRKLYGDGYVGKEKPSGELYQERKLDAGIHRPHHSADDQNEPQELPQGQIVQERPAATATIPIDQTALNRLKAQMMKAKLKGSPDAARLEAEYNNAATGLITQEPGVIVLGQMDNRMLAGSGSSGSRVPSGQLAAAMESPCVAGVLVAAGEDPESAYWAETVSHYSPSDLHDRVR